MEHNGNGVESSVCEWFSNEDKQSIFYLSLWNVFTDAHIAFLVHGKKLLLVESGIMDAGRPLHFSLFDF